MSLLRRLLLVTPVAALALTGMVMAEEPAKKVEPKPLAAEMMPASLLQDSKPAAPAATPAPAPTPMAQQGCGTVIAGQPCASCGPTCNTCSTCDSCNSCDSCGPRVGVFFDGLYWKVRNSDIPYARPVDDLTLSLPAGPVAQVQHDYETGYRAGFWFAITPQAFVRATYTSYDANSTDFTSAPIGTVLQSLVTHPNTANAAFDSLDAGASHDVELRIIDLDGVFRFYGDNNCSLNLSAIGGVRWARLEQDFVGLFVIEGEQGVFTSSNFEGIGPRMGLEGDLMFTSCLYGYGSGVLSLIVGRQTTDYLQVDVFQDILANTGYEKDRIVPVIDLEFGVGARLCDNHVNLRVGYAISSWYNLVTTNSLIQSVQQTDFVTNRDNIRDRITFDGLVLRAEVCW